MSGHALQLLVVVILTVGLSRGTSLSCHSFYMYVIESPSTELPSNYYREYQQQQQANAREYTELAVQNS